MLHNGLEIKIIPKEPGFFARSDGSIYTDWENADETNVREAWTKGEGLRYVHPCESSRPTARVWTRSRKIQELMLETFIGPRPEGMECCHKDDDSQNNCIANLRWDTRRNNALDLWPNEENDAYLASLSHEIRKQFPMKDIEEIRMINASRICKHRTLAAIFDCSSEKINMICNGIF
jgi:hypothetical protein